MAKKHLSVNLKSAKLSFLIEFQLNCIFFEAYAQTQIENV